MRSYIMLLIVLGCTVCFAEGARYLIITPDEFYDAILPLAEWKTKKGMLAKVVKLSEIGSQAWQIKAYITEAYNNWEPRPRYVLLVGDENIIPMPYYGGTSSDNYYTDVTGNILNELVPGRLPASNVDQLQTMVAKILNYERYPYMEDTLWFRKGTLIVREDYDTCDTIYWGDAYLVAEGMSRAGFVEIDTFSMVAGDNSDDVINAINDGRTYVLYRGSGTGYWWYPFTIYPEDTDNGFKLPIVTAFTCYTIPEGGFSWLRVGTPDDPKGAVGYVGVTTVEMSTEGARKRSALCRGFYRYVFWRTNAIRTLGEACEAGRRLLYHLFEDDYEYCGLICVGDPELNLWTYTPMELVVEHPQAIVLEPTTVVVEVSRYVDLSPVANALVCLMMDTTVYEYGYTDADGVISFYVEPQHVGDLHITVTGKNCLPYEGIISVIPAGAFIICDTYEVVDTINGNRDGIINPGESIALRVALKNIGVEVAESVYAFICGYAEGVTITDSEDYFGEIPPDSVVWGSGGFTFTVSDTVVAGYEVNFVLNIFDKAGEHWVAELPTLCVETGKLIIDSTIVIDTLPGDNINHMLDPGETSYLTCMFKNVGPSSLSEVTAVLTSSDTFVFIRDSVVEFDSILVDSVVSGCYEIEVSPMVLPGYDVEFEIQLIGDGGTYTYVDTIGFTLTVGRISTNLPTGPDEYGYWCYDDTDTLSGRAPVYEWFEIAPPEGPGNIIEAITDEDARITTVGLPFTFKYYGDEFDSISICSNGFLALGHETYRFGDNSGIPDEHGPSNMVAPFWCDLDPSLYGDIYEYYDKENHRWICEFKEVAHYGVAFRRETFQVILLDPAYYATTTGDGIIIFQYKHVADISTATVGIENGTEDVGIQYYYNGEYDTTAATIQDGRAVKFTTEPPVTPLSPWILLKSYSLVDTGGNNDSIANPGEWIQLYIDLQNNGNMSADSVVGKLTTTDTVAVICDSIAYFGTIGVDEVGTNQFTPFVIYLPKRYVSNKLWLRIDITANHGEYQRVITLAIDVVQSTGVEDETPLIYELSEGWPNPMVGCTNIRLQVPEKVHVKLTVYDVTGRYICTLVNDVLQPGIYTVVWDGTSATGTPVRNGVYFYRLEAGNYHKVRKLVVLR